MAPATAPVRTRQQLTGAPRFNEYGVAEATKIFGGTMVFADADGYAVPGADTAALEGKFLGIAEDDADNTDGTDGDINVKVEAARPFLMAKTGTIVQSDIGADLYADDDQTVALAADVTNRAKVGTLMAIEDGMCWVNPLSTAL